MDPSPNLTDRTMCVSILRVRVNSTSYAAALNQIFDWVNTDESHYVCAANVHMLMEAHDSPQYKQILNSADLITPDGMPLVWIMRLKGRHEQTRVYGPTLMLYTLEQAEHKNIPVGFYGSTPEVSENLVKRIREKYPKINITYTFSPPYRDLDQQENEQVTEKINSSGTRILFVGLGCPKQEKWMAEHRGKINAVMLGVGAAFDFHAGLKSQAPTWMQTIGLEWLYRLITEPRRLWRRYLYHNPRFVFLAIQDLLGFLR